jgi:thymidylate kinase
MNTQSHIEFIGPPGAGKSTIHRSLITDSRYYGELYDGAIERFVSQTYERRYRLGYRLVPSPLRSAIETLFLQQSIRRRLFAEFITERPAFAEVMYDAQRAVSHDRAQVVSLLQYAAERYQLGIETVHPGERLCLDEGFMMGAVSVLWRSARDQFSLSTYIDSVPAPETLVYVTAPTEVCLRRQRRRDDVVSASHAVGTIIDGQKRHEQACEAVLDVARGLESTEIVTVESCSDVETVVAELEEVLA